MKEIRQSETVTIKRSQIKFAPYNPKKHSEAAIQVQRKNFKDVGFLGGIVWNSLTGNLVSGHKRIMALDIHFGYNGSDETDYPVKVEKIELDEKQEKEQNIFMDAKATNTPQDYAMMADILPDIDYKNAGLSDSDLHMMSVLSPNYEKVGTPEQIVSEYQQLEKPYEERKQQIKDLKRAIRDEVSETYMGDPYVTLIFDDIENKALFCEMLKIDQYQKYVKGEVIADFIEKLMNG